MPIILSHIVDIGGDVFIKHLAHPRRETISHPRVEAPVVKSLLGNKSIQLYLRRTDGVFDLQPVAITCGVSSRMTKPALKEIAITQCKVAQRETDRGGK